MKNSPSLKILSALIIPCYFFISLSGCKDSAQNKLFAKIRSVILYNCDYKCKSVYFSIKIENNSSKLLCIPAEYKTSFASEYIFFINNDKGVEYQSSPARYLAIKWPNDGSKYIDWLLTQPNIIIEPHAAIIINNYIINKYDLSKHINKAQLQLFIYPCDRRIGSGDDYKNMSLESPVTYERNNR